MDNDPWLTRWLPLVEERKGDQPILELGCGSGRDSATLADAGHAVVGLDVSAESIERARARVPSARFYCQDIRASFPVEPGLGVVLASLSLHYFAWDETVELVERIREHVRPGGVLLCRLNSVNDMNFGAAACSPISENFCLVDGKSKRFFDRAALDRLFSRGWRVLAQEELIVNRYAHPKALWEVILERDA